MEKLLRFLNKKGISADILVVVLLIVALAISIVLFITLGKKSAGTEMNLANLTEGLNVA